MIRRIQKTCDLKDIIKSCPSGVIDDIYKIEYYIQGYNTVIECSFTKVGEQLEVILPTGQLETLPDGILMRRAYYKVVDSSYPDGYYNLEFEDCMNIWLGENEGEAPVKPEYVTEDELSSTLSSYATQSWVSDQGYLTAETLPSDIATQSWVQSQGYAPESWVRNNFVESSALSSYATKSFVTSRTDLLEEHDMIMSAMISDCATRSWVSEQGYLTAVPLEYATQSWVQSQGYAYDLDLSALASRVSDLEINYGDAISITNNILHHE